MLMMQQYMQQMMQNPQMQQQMQQMMQQMQNPQAQAQKMTTQTKSAPEQNNNESSAGYGSAASAQDDHVFDAVFAAQQTQYMRQLEFMNQVKTQDAPTTLIGHPTGPIYECRFADDFRPLKYCKN